MTECAEPGCDKSNVAWGLCREHHQTIKTRLASRVKYVDLTAKPTPGWQFGAECRGHPGLMFAKGDRGKVLCYRCPVWRDCLVFAVRNNERDGIWGGLSDDERRAFLKESEAGTRTPDHRSGVA